MSRFLLLLVFIAWMSWTPHAPVPVAGPMPTAQTPAGHNLMPIAWFMGGYLLLVLSTATWNRRLAARTDGESLNANLKHFNRVMSFARLAVVGWFFLGVVFMGWGALIDDLLLRLHLHPERLDSPGLIIGCLPAFLAWAGLWWSQYPADVCFREQGLLSQLDDGYPIHRPPPLGSYLRANLRLQLLFTIVPVLALVLFRDLFSLALQPFGLNEQDSLGIQLVVSLVTAAFVLIFAPELLRRVLQTEPMPDGPLRQRLESVCRRHRIRYRGVLLWRTDHNMGNAAVMGMIPQTRYILMSDLLLETMTDEQIEAVFAHEVGHIIHRHMLWFAVFFGAMMFALVGFTGPLGDKLDRLAHQAVWPPAVAMFAGSVGFLALFLYISRKFERQADVFAARTIQEDLAAGAAAHGSHVGSHGARVFSSALNQVARINCIPLTAWSWCHGSIAHRIDYLQALSHDPRRTVAFDRFMSRLYGTLMFSLFGFGVWAMLTLAGQK